MEHAVGLGAEAQRLLAVPVRFGLVRRLGERHAFEPVHRRLMDVADGEVRVQRLFAAERRAAGVLDRQLHAQPRAQVDREAQRERMRPQRARRRVVLRRQHDARAGGRFGELPVEAAREAVRRQLLVGRVVAEPREHQRHAAAHRLALRVLALARGPQHVAAGVAVGQHLRAAQRDQRTAAGAIEAQGGATTGILRAGDTVRQ